MLTSARSCASLRSALLSLCVWCVPGNIWAAEWFVAAGANGTGTQRDPFGSIQAALSAALPGDTVTIGSGTYHERIRTVRAGVPDGPLRIRAHGERGTVVVTASGRVLTVEHAHTIVEGIVFDGQYGDGDVVKIGSAAHQLTFRDNEVRRSSRDLIDLSGPTDVLIEGCLVHHALNAARGRTDAHGIVAGPVRNLTIRDTEIHTFSGDGFQVDPGRDSPGWSDVVLEDLHIWLQPLPSPENGFAEGIVPGENAVDTKASATLPRATLRMRNITASGFRDGLIGNMAAFNLKEHIDATLDGITVFDSEIAFRLRGAGRGDTGAHVSIMNAVVHDVLTAYRYEDDIQRLRIWNNTAGRNVTRPFQAAASRLAGLEVRNLLILGALPSEAQDASNLSVTEQDFVDPTRHDYRLTPGSAAIDRGIAIPAITVDRDGTSRPVGRGYDVGAFEWHQDDSRVSRRTTGQAPRARQSEPE